MNKDRRKKLEQIVGTIEQALADLEMVKDEEQEAFDNMPEGLQQGERGQRMEEIIDLLDSAHGEIESAKDQLTDAINE